MGNLTTLFSRHLAQTSRSPIGLEITHAVGAWLYCADGRRCLDFVAGIGVSALGHGHPAIVRAIDEQARRHLHVMVYGEYVIEAQVKLAARVAELMPRDLSRVYFTGSGAEAVEGALKLAKKHTRRAALVAFEGAYHGDTIAALALMGNESFREPFGPLYSPVRHLPYDDADALDAIDSTVAAVVIEPVQAEGGVRIPSVPFMKALRRRCDETGALLIFDEVLTGFGRTGKLFGMEHFGTNPDIVVLAKALGGGLPLGAFCASDDLMTELSHDPPLGHLTTFGGHPLSCAAGLASLEVIVNENLAERATRLGNEIVSRLKDLCAPEISAVRGIGLLIGVEFCAASVARQFVAESLANGVVINWTLNAENVVRLAPPLNIGAAEIDFAIEGMRRALESTRKRDLS